MRCLVFVSFGGLPESKASFIVLTGPTVYGCCPQTPSSSRCATFDMGVQPAEQVAGNLGTPGNH